jgi:hypothetical protein
VLRRMRCSAGCGGRVVAAWLVTGPVMNMRVRPRRCRCWVRRLGADRIVIWAAGAPVLHSH